MPKMQARIDRIIVLLAQHIYEHTDAFIRELIQNAHDAVIFRMAEDAAEPGRIEVTLDPARRTITFEDNGTGMDRGLIEEALSTVGASGTLAQRERLAQTGPTAGASTIGQFGIGFLAAFVVAERVDVFTRRRGSDEGWHWFSTGGEEYSLEPCTDVPRSGTQVVVTLGAAHLGFLEEATVGRAIRHHAEFLPVPVLLNGKGPVNCPHPPWAEARWPAGCNLDGLTAWLQERQGDNPLLVIPFAFDDIRARGVVYVTDGRKLGAADVGQVDIYQNRMLVRRADRELLSPWAAFLRGIVDTAGVPVTAGRDNLRRGAAYIELRRRIDAVVMAALIELAVGDPEYFRRVCEWHEYHLKLLAAENRDFLRAIIRHLTFETSAGPLNLPDYLERHAAQAATRDRIYFLGWETNGAQLETVCTEQGIAVVRTRNKVEEHLLHEYVRECASQVQVIRVDDGTWRGLHAPVEPGSERLLQDLRRRARQAARGAGLGEVEVSFRRIRPATTNGVVVRPQEWDTRRNLQALLANPFVFRSLEPLARQTIEATPPAPVEWYLNADAPLVRRLAAAARTSPGGQVEAVLRALFVAGLADAVRDWTPAMMEAMQTATSELAEHCLAAVELPNQGDPGTGRHSRE